MTINNLIFTKELKVGETYQLAALLSEGYTTNSLVKFSVNTASETNSNWPL